MQTQTKKIFSAECGNNSYVMATLFGQAVRWPLVGRTKTLAASSHRLRGPQDISCLWRAVATVRAVSASEMGFESCGSSSTRSSMAQPFLAKLVSHVDRSRNVATPFCSKCYPLLMLLGNPIAELFTSTRTPFALRNTYYSRSRSGASTRYNGRLGGNWGGNSGGRGDGSNAWRRFKAAINALPQSALVWGIIGTNAIVFLAWQYAEQSYVGVTYLAKACFKKQIPCYPLLTDTDYCLLPVAATVSRPETANMDVPKLHDKLGQLETRCFSLRKLSEMISSFISFTDHLKSLNLRSCVSHSQQLRKHPKPKRMGIFQ